ncbi:MAG: outer membrane protein assembly factor BamB [Glaciecola sp.]|jgi:outer membrane protein assembly factor BamB
MRHRLVLAAGLGLFALALSAVSLQFFGLGEPADVIAIELAEAEPIATSIPSPTPVDEVPAPVALLGEPWGTASGLLQFRGNPSHTWYGAGPVPFAPAVAWRHPERPMCVNEVTGHREVVTTDPETGEETVEQEPIIKRWCGTGWTGQPVVWERPDGVTEVIVGAFDGAVHFVDADTGQRTRPAFQTGFMIKGSVSIDPDGFPLLYTGSRDNYFRVIALDRDVPTELWRMSPHPQGIWNNDWDGNASIVDGILYEGGEDSWLRAVELHRTTDADGLVQVDPQIVFEMQGWTQEQLDENGDRNVSIESSVAVDVERQRLWFSNSGGRVAALDISNIRDGVAPIVFDFLVGDDVDSSIVLERDGTAIVAVEYERRTARSKRVGQLLKLDPERPEDPIVWSVAVPDDPRPGVAYDDGGIWSTPALYAGHLYVTTHPGDLLVVDASTGEVTMTERFGYHEWSSPVVVDDTLVVARCQGGALLAWSLQDPSAPIALWSSDLPSGSCIESTPAVWKGSIYVGSRDGYLYAWR